MSCRVHMDKKLNQFKTNHMSRTSPMSVAVDSASAINFPIKSTTLCYLLAYQSWRSKSKFMWSPPAAWLTTWFANHTFSHHVSKQWPFVIGAKFPHDPIASLCLRYVVLPRAFLLVLAKSDTRGRINTAVPGRQSGCSHCWRERVCHQDAPKDTVWIVVILGTSFIKLEIEVCMGYFTQVFFLRTPWSKKVCHIFG
jgi:hypothetical protein